jgi:hypothetical protein
LNRAVSLKPDFAQAHLSLGGLYREMGYLDLALNHLRVYFRLAREAGPPAGVSAEPFREQEASFEKELSRLAKEVEDRENKYVLASAGKPVQDRAALAMEQNLAGKARDMLLESHIAAFGDRGLKQELELLLGTGRPKEVWEWTGPEHKERLGASTYHLLRAQALAASGAYALAEEECEQLARSLAGGAQGQEAVRLREVMALWIGRAVLEHQPGGESVPRLALRARSRYELRQRIAGFARDLKRQADVTVLRGLLALEEGEVGEAEIALREALALWKDEATAASGGGMDFNGRVVAQGYLGWLE